MYPQNDIQFEETTITAVKDEAPNGWSISRADGWSFWVPATSPVQPVAGMVARFYGRGIGYIVRGLYLDGRQVYYRTEAEDKKHQDEQLYGVDASDWLKRWDEGKSVWSIAMGGFGPSYEQALQIAMAEILRILLGRAQAVTAWSAELDEACQANSVIVALGLSGAQWSAARNLALCLYRDGPQGLMADPRVKDRFIQICHNFPNRFFKFHGACTGLWVVKDPKGLLNHTTIDVRPDWAIKRWMDQEQTVTRVLKGSPVPSWEGYEALGYSVVRCGILEHIGP